MLAGGRGVIKGTGQWGIGHETEGAGGGTKMMAMKTKTNKGSDVKLLIGDWV